MCPHLGATAAVCLDRVPRPLLQMFVCSSRYSNDWAQPRTLCMHKCWKLVVNFSTTLCCVSKTGKANLG